MVSGTGLLRLRGRGSRFKGREGKARPIVTALAMTLLTAGLAACGATGSTSTATSTTSTSTSTSTTSTSTTSTASRPSRTQQITYQPFTASGIDLDLTVTAHDTGTCIRDGTQATPTRCFRCFGATTSRGSAIYDPCFAGPLGTAGPLVCPSTPTSSDVIEFAVTSVTSDQPSSMQRFPWAMQLVTGQVCLKVNAAWGGLGPYACQPPLTERTVAHCHPPTTSQPTWIAQCQARQTAFSPFTPQALAKVWF